MLVEALASFAGRSREAAKVERDVREILKQLWDEQQLLQRKTQAQTERASFAAAQAKAMQAVEGAGPSDVERLKRHLQVVQWGIQIAWDLANQARHREALVATYTSAWKEYLLLNKSITTEQLQRIAQSAATGGRRPADLTEALLFDMATIYLQGCRMGTVYARALTAVPMLLEESVRSPEATGQELFNRWQLRADLEANMYHPTAPEGSGTPASG